MKILVDDRESGGAVLPALGAMDGLEIRIERLPVGDYLLDDLLLFERKTLLDLTASIKDGRLFSQGLRLAGSPLRCAIILEGRSQDLSASGMRREAIQGALIHLSLFLGIPLLRAMDAGETARLMLYAARQGRQFMAGAYPRQGHRPHGKPRVQTHILQGFPGVGPTRAKRLLDHFGSIEAVVTADLQALAGVSGIGQVTAETIHWAVHEQPAPLDLDENDWFPV